MLYDTLLHITLCYITLLHITCFIHFFSGEHTIALGQTGFSQKGHESPCVLPYVSLSAYVLPLLSVFVQGFKVSFESPRIRVRILKLSIESLERRSNDRIVRRLHGYSPSPEGGSEKRDPTQKSPQVFLESCVSSLRRGHANLLSIVPILTDDPRRESYVYVCECLYV